MTPKYPNIGTDPYGVRINRFLASAGIASRRACEEHILEGRVSINGSVCRNLATRVTPEDDVRINGRNLHQASHRYLLLHKPPGYVSTRSDRYAARTIFDLLPSDTSHLFHVGRLDKESEGLLLLTNDGLLAQHLLHPSHGIDKEYEVTLDKPFTSQASAALKKGIWMEGGVARVASVKQLSPYRIKLLLHQGLKRQIRVMLGTLGFKVKRLIRVRLGPLKLHGLAAGRYRDLKKEELELLRAPHVKKERKTFTSPLLVMVALSMSFFSLLMAAPVASAASNVPEAWEASGQPPLAAPARGETSGSERDKASTEATPSCTSAVEFSKMSHVQREYIVVSGGPSLLEWEQYKTTPHDHWWANFIRAARNRLAQLHDHATAHDEITWMVYRPAYERRGRRQEGQDLLANIASVRDRYKIHLFFFDSQKEFLNYLNQGRRRDREKIADFEYFGHSNRACFMFDYSNEIDTGSKVWLHETELTQIHPSIFTPHAFIKSWGCHTGESMSRCWLKATGHPMIGAIGTTSYADSDTPGWHPTLAPNGRWSH